MVYQFGQMVVNIVSRADVINERDWYDNCNRSTRNAKYTNTRIMRIDARWKRTRVNPFRLTQGTIDRKDSKNMILQGSRSPLHTKTTEIVVAIYRAIGDRVRWRGMISVDYPRAVFFLAKTVGMKSWPYLNRNADYLAGLIRFLRSGCMGICMLPTMRATLRA